MKSLVRWSTTVGLVGSTVLGSFFGLSLRALAIPQEQILEKLQTIPVFTIADQQGAPLVASSNNNQAKVAGVFISQTDAQNFLTKLKTENPQLGNQVNVVPVSLGEIYKLDQQNGQQSNGLDFAYVPNQQQVQSAQTLLAQQRQEYKGGVPLFVARGGEEKGYLTVAQGNEEVIPFFFDQQQLQAMIDKFKKEEPNLASTVTVEVVPLEGVLQAMQTSNDAMLSKVVLVPSSESIQFLRNLSQQSQTPQQRQQPQQRR